MKTNWKSTKLFVCKIGLIRRKSITKITESNFVVFLSLFRQQFQPLKLLFQCNFFLFAVSFVAFVKFQRFFGFLIIFFQILFVCICCLCLYVINRMAKNNLYLNLFFLKIILRCIWQKCEGNQENDWHKYENARHNVVVIDSTDNENDQKATVSRKYLWEEINSHCS